ncbi:Phthiocerol/phenolphthiocerol synthesis polyketide synthase type I PpsA [Corynebacterium ciconiae DSM 44920]|uniref:type I polyketide synthase n=1 Tax=Corynebacterium ciconiae TaxID=227319 RepID=UPI00037AF12E|nr:type I polyketide synthase [Corynebacterium ciconiae]WKD60246.1 Phthiocerol/phenolphthiocerol synthesis polyketide synthase type I PpsA [Corynebacterium ciconiae DSM 44920]
MNVNQGQGPISVNELSAWLTRWVAENTELSVDEVDVDTPMQSFGLSSRDVVVLSGELENLTGVQLDATVAYQYPTIRALAEFVCSGGATSQAGATAGGASAHDAPRGGALSRGAHDIAIVGVAARMPGAPTAAAMWERVIDGEVMTGDLPLGRWSEYAADEVTQSRLSKVPTTGGYLEDIQSFDAEFFGLSPVEAANMDPQQRLSLELTWEALEHAGIPANTLRGTRTGVYMGSSNNDYGMLVAADPNEMHPYALTGTASSIVPNRISYAFDFRGPSVNVDTACSSSLVAVHQAVRDLRTGDADTAIAGGVNVLASPFVSIAFGELGVISEEGIKAFSDDAKGIVRSDGAGVLVLKRVDDALAAGDNILAVIKGSAVNSDGRSNGLTAPNPDAQVDVLRRAYADAQVDPAAVDYVEAHGTGTILGDPIEAQALGTVLGAGRSGADPLLLGSAKTNFGHSESAAGAAGMIKVVLSMVHDTVPPLAGFTAPNRYINFEADHLEAVEDPREWPEYSGHKLAGVSGFGFGGTNAHVVVSEFVAADYEQEQLSQQPQLAGEGGLVTVSGLVPSRRKAAAAALVEWMDAHPEATPAEVARATAKRNHGRSRAAVVAADHEELRKRLALVAEGKKSHGIAVADSPAQNGPVFVYSGFGSQHRKMAKDLFSSSSLFAERIRELDRIIAFESGWSLEERILNDELSYDTETAQVGITAIQIALTDYLAQLGVTPAAVLGMSMGEIAAAYAAGGVNAHDAMVIACHRSRLMGEGERSLPEDELGAMALVETASEDLPEGIEAAVYAGPGMTTVGGPREAVTAFVEQLESEGKFARLLNVKGAGHTSALDPILGELYAETAHIEPKPLTIPLFSSVERGRVFAPGEVVHGTDYWVTCTRHSVWFQDATEQAFAHGYDTLVEISPNPVALMPMMNTAFTVGKPDAQLLFVLKRKVPAEDSVRETLAKLYAQGQPVNVRALYGDGPCAEIPTMRWKKQRYWTAARPAGGSPQLPGAKVVLPDGSVAFSTQADLVPSSHALIDAAAQALLPGARVVAVEDRSPLAPSGEITTTASTSLGGVDVRVYAVDGGASTLVAEGFAASPSIAGAAGETAQATAPAAPSQPQRPGVEEAEVDAQVWDPASGETVEERLRMIVSESMGYDLEDLPAELPLIDLGLDSLMGMRIKNRIEHDFQIPPLQVQALRDASVADVVQIVSDKVAARDNGADAVAQPVPAVADSPATESAPAAAPTQQEGGVDRPASAESTGVGVAPRDASERLVFATWATITGRAARGVTSPLPEISEEQAEQMAARLTERGGVDVSADAVRAAETLEPLANIVREGLETEVEGNIRVLRERPEGSAAPALFMFHPAGGSSVVYQPLMRRLPEEIPVYGVERLEGSFTERAAHYVDDIVARADGHPIVLGGWSFGGALAMEVARQLQGSANEPKLVALLDTVQPSEKAPDTMEETKARWGRYAAFASKTYGIDFPVPYELLESAGEEALLGMLTEFLATTDASEHGLSAGVLEHQRASFVDNRILDQVDFHTWAEVSCPVVLFRAERMHEGAIELEPRYASIDEDGGWSSIVDELEIVHLKGDHLAVVDEPEIAKVGAHLTRRIDELE